MTAALAGRRHALVLGLVCVITVVAYRGVIANGFVYDDLVTVVKNPAVRSLSRAPEWITSPYAVSANRGGTNYRPVVVATYALDYAAWGGRPAGFHATNLAIHLGVVALVYLLAVRLWKHALPATVAAAWMALHPINAEAVNYVSARSSTLAAAWLLAAVALYDQWAEPKTHGGRGRRSSWWLAGALSCGLLALGAKESAAVLPLLIVVWDRARFGDTVPWGASLGRSALFWGLLAAWLGLRAAVVVGGIVGDSPPELLIQAAAFGAKIINTAVVQSLWPVRMAIDYAWPLELGRAAVLGSLAGAAVVIVLAAGLAWVDRRMAWCAAWFGASLLPVLALPLITRLSLYQEHRVYLAEIGAAWLVGAAAWWVTVRLQGRRRTRPALVVVAVALVAAAGWLDAERTRVWADQERLWEDVLAKYPTSAVARNERGLRLLNAGRIEEAEQEFLAALRSMPNSVYAHLMLGMTYDKRGDPTRALAEYHTALQLRPNFVEARIRLGLLYEELGAADDALAEYERAIRDDPWASPALVLSAGLMERQGRTDEALAQYRRVASDDPIYDDAQLRLGALLLTLQRWAEARATFTAYLSRHPDSAGARYYIGVTHAREGRDDAAEEFLRDAARLGPSDAEARYELGLLAARRNQWAEAAEWAGRVLAIDPSHAGARFTAATAAERLGDTSAALGHYRALLSSPPKGAAGDALQQTARSAISRLAKDRSATPETRPDGGSS